MTVKIDKFGGIAPRLHPSLLSDGMAVTAHNCRLKNGKLVPIREPLLVSDIPSHLENGLSRPQDARSIHIWRKRDGSFEFILFPGLTWSAPGNVADDDRMRLILSGETGFTFTDKDGKQWSNAPAIYLRDPSTQYREEPVSLCMNPIVAPKVERGEGAQELGDSRIYTRFFFTWTDALGRESPCSPPSLVKSGGAWIDGLIEHMDGDPIHFEPVADLPEEATALRIWKVVTGKEDGYIQFVKEIGRADAEASGGFTIAIKEEEANETIREIEAPPADLRCIQDVPGAFYCGISKSNPKTVFFSDVDLLYSWPVAFRYDVRDNVVALAVTSNSVFALTDGWPYVISGTAPESMTVAKIAGPASCVSERGVCVFKNSVYFVSNSGLMSIYNDANAGTVCTNVTEKMFSDDQWAALNPSSCVMGHYKGALRLFFTLEDGSHRGLVIDLSEQPSVAITTHNEVAKCACVDVAADELYYIREGEEA